MIRLVLGVVEFFVALPIFVFVVRIGGDFITWLDALHFFPRTIVMALMGYCLWVSLVWVVGQEKVAAQPMVGFIFGVGKFLALLLLLQLIFLAGGDLIDWLGTLLFIPRSGG